MKWMCIFIAEALHKLSSIWCLRCSAKWDRIRVNKMFQLKRPLTWEWRRIQPLHRSWVSNNVWCAMTQCQHKWLQESDEYCETKGQWRWVSNSENNKIRQIYTNWANFKRPGNVFKYPVFNTNVDVLDVVVVVRVITTECDIFSFVGSASWKWKRNNN